MSVEIIEVGPRDGLQNEATTLSLDDRIWIVENLALAGLRRIEIGAFVSPQWVPQMANTSELCKRIFAKRSGGAKLRYSVLVPNARGMTDAIQAEVKEVAVFGACSESFSMKNINCTIDDSFARFREVIKLARQKKIKVRGYLSTAFGCPYEGKVPFKRVLKLTEKMLDLGVFEVSIGDTIGVASPKQVRELVKPALRMAGAKKLALHFHDTRGTALANVLSGHDLGINKFDSSVGGLGGCPYAKGASGNLATEDLVYMLSRMGVKTGVKLEQILAMREPLEKMIGRKLPGRFIQAGLAKGL